MFRHYSFQLTSLFIVLFSYGCNNAHENERTQNDKTVIAFGSCATQESTNLMWDAVAAHNPDVFIWLGDNIYGDSRDLSVLQEKYTRQKQQPAYQRFLETEVEVIGTWDDHDYGENDAGKEYPEKEGSKKLLLDFLDVPKDAKVWNHPGVYQSYTYGEEGKRVKVILLDTRWFRDSLAPDTTGRGRYAPATGGTMLGTEQWKWLENEVLNAEAEVLIIGSSIQVHSQEHGWEKWANFPNERKRLLNLLAKTDAQLPIIISGDRHLAEVSRLQMKDRGAWLYDVTSSGMTHVFVRDSIEPNRHRISPVVMKLNWALIEVDWRETGPAAMVEIRGLADSLHYKHVLEL
jgi:alkaline phosphatase D